MNVEIGNQIDEYKSQYKQAESLAEKLNVIVDFRLYIASFNDGLFGPEVDEKDENEVVQELETLIKDLNQYCIEQGTNVTNINDMCDKRQQRTNKDART